MLTVAVHIAALAAFACLAIWSIRSIARDFTRRIIPASRGEEL